MAEQKRIILDENFLVFYSDHATWSVGYKMNEALVKLAARKGYVVTIKMRGREE